MTTFEDGPAKGKTLTLRRSPVFLRVTECGGKFDALDLLDDKPKPQERLFCYQLQSHSGNSFVDWRDPKSGKRYGYSCAISSYALCQIQPDDAVMRDNKSWGDWAETFGAKLVTP